MKRYLACALLLVLSACDFTARQDANLRAAVAQQQPIMADPLFSEIIRELAVRGEIEWERRLPEGAVPDTADDLERLEWVLAQYETHGLFNRDQIRPWRNFWPFSATTAITVPYTDYMRLNLWNVSENEISLANTLMHERGHNFGLIHPQDQTRPTNMCDPTYILGDLGEAVLRHRNRQFGESAFDPVCPALCDALERRGMWSACSAEQD